MSALRNSKVGAALLVLGTILIAVLTSLQGTLAIGAAVLATAAMVAGTLILGTSGGGRPV